ncbi:helix-turn-helix domain-containing protein [Thermoactinomyces sp. CICC 10521]|uniref:helix-turn-helix domain-containing protein n=1 Tax=Thermoactinomyces sp. CICC 10521 TaxID=2767426 RepID=UPI0018DE3AD3|nr:helix-turn-helix domain-containing protein [Thermoactinomyces sp. CICC 10521]MBH8609102.1 helix-turn-helix domain-containing protein [Thermoactinomyces sp. CICC 10521]
MKRVYHEIEPFRCPLCGEDRLSNLRALVKTDADGNRRLKCCQCGYKWSLQKAEPKRRWWRLVSMKMKDKGYTAKAKDLPEFVAIIKSKFPELQEAEGIRVFLDDEWIDLEYEKIVDFNRLFGAQVIVPKSYRKLSEEVISEIKAYVKEGKKTQREIADLCGVHVNTVRRFQREYRREADRLPLNKEIGDETIRKIRDLYINGWSKKKISRQFQLNETAVHDIVSWKKFKHVL